MKTITYITQYGCSNNNSSYLQTICWAFGGGSLADMRSCRESLRNHTEADSRTVVKGENTVQYIHYPLLTHSNAVKINDHLHLYVRSLFLRAGDHLRWFTKLKAINKGDVCIPQGLCSSRLSHLPRATREAAPKRTLMMTFLVTIF